MDRALGELLPFAADLAAKAALVLLACAAGVAGLRRGSAATRHAVTMTGLVAVLALVPLLTILPRVTVPVFSPRPAIDHGAALAEDADDRSLDEGASALAVAGTGATGPALAAPARSPRLRVPWALVAFAAWALGALLILARMVHGALRVRALLGRAAPLEGQSARHARSLAAQLGLRRPLRLLESAELPVAITARVRAPALVLPVSAREWHEGRLHAVLLHELAHVQRKDCLWLVVSEIAVALYWPLPLVWLAAAQARRDREQAADDLVLLAGVRPSDYAAQLLAIVRALRPQAALPAVAVASRSDLTERLSAILDPFRARRGLTVLQGRLQAAAFLAAVGALAPLRPGPAPAQEVAVAAKPAVSTRVAAVVAIPAVPAPAVRAPSVPAAAVAVQPQLAPAPRPAPRTILGTLADALAESDVRLGARPLARSAVRLVASSGSGAIWFARAQSAHAAERWDEAGRGFQKAYELGYRAGVSAYNAACALARQGKTDEAIAWLHKSVEQGFDAADHLEHDDDLDSLRQDPRLRALRQAARAREQEEKRGEQEAAAEAYRGLGAKATSGALFAAGKQLYRAARYDLASEAYQRAAAQGGREGVALYNAACSEALGGNKAAALELLGKAIEAGFDDPHLLEKDGDLDEVRDDPRYAAAALAARELAMPLGAHHGRLSFPDGVKWTEVAARLEAYLRDHPGSGRAAYGLGVAQYVGGELAAAKSNFERALERGYRRSTTLYNLACVSARLGEKDQAFGFLDRALAAGFDQRWIVRDDVDLEALRDDARFGPFEQRLAESGGK